jgi:hypothetical protein
MSKKALPISDRLRINCIKSLADLYDYQGMKQLAVSFCQDQLSFDEKYLLESHVNIAHLAMKIGEFYEDIQKIIRPYFKHVRSLTLLNSRKKIEKWKVLIIFHSKQMKDNVYQYSFQIYF